MGCDIHWYSETKKDNKWVCDQAASFKMEIDGDDDYPDMDDFPNRDRDYWFFGLIQPNVRSAWEWSFPERVEIPQDLSTEVQAKFDHWGGDAHSEGWLTRAELQAKLEDLKLYKAKHLLVPTEATEAFHHHTRRLEEVMSNLTEDVPDTDQRIVFWFDS